ncbi:hypothetical protein Tco_1077700, partial [Tanacetum coccineum]
MGRYEVQLMSIRNGGKELLPSTQSRTFLLQRKAYFFRSSLCAHSACASCAIGALLSSNSSLDGSDGFC